MNHKAWLTVFGIFAVLLIGGAGFYAFTGYRSYADSLAQWDDKVGTIESLERRVPYPNKDNSEALAAKIEVYEKSVQDLFESLNTYQRPLNTTLPNTQFQQLVSTKVQTFREYAQAGGLEIEDSSEFQLGYDIYSATIPPQELVPVLDYELEAIDHLLRQLVDLGAEKLVTFERDPIPGEEGGADEFESGVVHKYPIRIRFTGTHASFQQFINSIANDSDFFYIVRVLKVRNETSEGPVKLTSSDGATDIPRFVNPTTQEMAGMTLLQEWGLGVVSDEELEAKAKEAGFEQSKQDARVLMGQEKLNVFMVVDIVRFVSPEEQAAAGEDKKEEESDSRRRR